MKTNDVQIETEKWKVEEKKKNKISQHQQRKKEGRQHVMCDMSDTFVGRARLLTSAVSTMDS